MHQHHPYIESLTDSLIVLWIIFALSGRNVVIFSDSVILWPSQDEMPNDDEGRMGKVVLYVTSVQVVRETHEMCKQVVHILRSRRVAFIQKDVFLHPDYGRELSERLEVEEEEEEEDGDGSITLPQVKQNPQRLV